MWLPRTLCFVGVIMLANCEGASTTVESLMTTPEFKVLSSPMYYGQNTKRFLRIHKATKTVAAEERAISLPSIEVLQRWAKQGMLSDEVVHLLSAGNKVDDLLTGSLLNAWVSYVNVFNKENPLQKMNMIPTLTARFGDEALATMIQSAKKLPKTEALGNQMQTELIQHWMSIGKSPDEVFMMLKLNKAKSLLFDMPQVNSWVAYVDDFSSSKQPVSMITTLRSFYTDEQVAKMIVIARRNVNTEDAAIRVEKELLRTWFNNMESRTNILRLLKLDSRQASKSYLYPLWERYVDLFNKVDPRFKKDMLEGWMKKGLITEETYRLLMLGNAADDFLNGSMLTAWYNYVKVFNKENPAETVSLLAMLTARFGDEALATMIQSAKKLPKTEALGNQMQTEMIRHWMSIGKSPDEVFILLKLNKAKSLLFDMPQVNSWVAYVDDFSSSKQPVSMITTLRSFYTDEQVAKMIVIARRNVNTEDAAIRVEKELLRTWFNNMESRTNILRLLKLDSRQASKSYLYPLWERYVDLFNKVDPRFKKDMLERWMKKGLITEETYRLLMLGNAADDFLNGSMLTAWYNYVKVFNKENPAETVSLLAMLTARFGDEAVSTMIESAKKIEKTSVLAKQVQAEQFKHWIKAGKIPDDVFVLLKLNTAKASLFEQPQLNTWVAYFDVFNNAGKRTLYSTLSTRYNDAALTEMLVLARNIPSSKSVAMRIESEQMRFWYSKSAPSGVFKSLNLDQIPSAKLFESPLYTVWTTYLNQVNALRSPGLTKLDEITSLTAVFGVDKISAILVAAQRTKKTREIATKLLNEQYKFFLGQMKAPTKVYDLWQGHLAADNSMIKKLINKYTLEHSKLSKATN